MGLSTVDRRFARFCRDSDPRALAYVFDRTAPELLRVAAHLVGDTHLAEDLVQQTFLCAIEQRAAYDTRQRVLPWLLGILGNRARHLRRQESRRRNTELPELLGRDDPVDATSARELESILHRVLQSLPQPYRQVLTLHLEHGLKANEIARVLERPSGSVRTQLVRGMEMLRRALPRGVATFAPITALSGPGMGQVRRSVLAAAGGGDSAPLATTLAAEALMVKKAQVVAALAAPLLVVVGWWAWPRTDAEVPALLETLEPPAQTARLEPSGDPEETSRPTSELAPQPRRTPVGPAAPGTVVVRVLHSGGEPAAGLRLRWWPEPDDAAVAERITDAGGRLRIEELTPGPWVVDVARFADRTPLQQEVEVVSGDEVSVSIELPAGLQVTGQVLDPSGDPVGGASVWGDCGPDAFAGMLLAEADALGRFAVRDLTTGVRMWARKAGYQPSEQEMVFGSPGAEVEASLVLGRGAVPVTGFVEDASGSPAVADVIVFMDAQRIWEGWGGGRSLATRSGSDGRFFLEEVPAGQHVFVAELDAEGQILRAAESAAITPGSPPVRLRMDAGAAVTGVARLGEDPLAGATVRATCRVANLPRAYHHLYRGSAITAADGTYRIPGLLPGAYIVEASAGGARQRIGVELGEGEVRRWDPDLRLEGLLRLRLIGQEGEPLAGWQIGVRRIGGLSLVASAVTGPAGRARLQDLEDGAYEIAVHARLSDAPDQKTSFSVFPTLLRELTTGLDEQVVRIDARSGAGSRIVGRVVTGGGRPIPSAQVQLGREGWSVFWNEYGDARTGTFVLAGIPEGEYSLFVRPEGYPGRWFIPVRVEAGRNVDLGDVVFDPPGNLSVTLPDGGVEGVSAWLIDRDGRRHGLRLGGEGLTSGPVVTGEYALHVLTAEGVPHAQTVHITAGSQSLSIRPEPADATVAFVVRVPEHEARASHCDVVLEVRDEAGTPVLEERIFAGFDDPGTRSVLRRRGLRSGRYTVSVRDRELPLRASGEVLVRAGEGSELLLVLQ